MLTNNWIDKLGIQGGKKSARLQRDLCIFGNLSDV